jgi:sugar/nucleoside kinase (ribokinase family)
MKIHISIARKKQMMKKKFDILVCGEINPDLILSGDVEPVFGQVEKLIEKSELTIGSSSVIFACGAARLGLKVSFIGKCGNDLFGKFMLEQMDAKGITLDDVFIVPDDSTGFSVILNKGTDRAILTFPGLIPSLKEEDITDEMLCSARHLHVASYFLQTALQKGMVKLFHRAHDLGLTTSLDTNWDPKETWIGLDSLLPLTDVFLPNETEACSITRTHNMQSAVRELNRKVETLAMKLGAQGALGMRCEQKAHIASLKVEVVDTIGAGDSFDAGFLYGWLKGWDFERALRLGVICGSLSTQEAGGTKGQPTLENALVYLDS